MADATGDGLPLEAAERRIEALAQKLLRNPDENGLAPGDIEGARLIARRVLEDSEARTNDPATRDPENEGVIRRSSGETASSGDTQVRRSPA